MQITPINAINYVSGKLSTRKNNENEPPKTESQPNFKAELYVTNAAKKRINASIEQYMPEDIPRIKKTIFICFGKV